MTSHCYRARVFVYSLKDAMFLPVDVRYMTSLETKDNGFDRLQLPDNHKRMIQSATSAHMRRKHIERLIKKRGASERLLTQDFIQGKGHGPHHHAAWRARHWKDSDG